MAASAAHPNETHLMKLEETLDTEDLTRRILVRPSGGLRGSRTVFTQTDLIFKSGDLATLTHGLAGEGGIRSEHILDVIDQNDVAKIQILIDRCVPESFNPCDALEYAAKNGKINVISPLLQVEGVGQKQWVSAVGAAIMSKNWGIYGTLLSEWAAVRPFHDANVLTTFVAYAPIETLELTLKFMAPVNADMRLWFNRLFQRAVEVCAAEPSRLLAVQTLLPLAHPGHRKSRALKTALCEGQDDLVDLLWKGSKPTAVLETFEVDQAWGPMDRLCKRLPVKKIQALLVAHPGKLPMTEALHRVKRAGEIATEARATTRHRPRA